jgi:DNA-binding NarL/FixJ family response regulator
MARGTAVKIVLSAEERGELETLVRRRKSSHGAATRARIVLLAAEGLNNSTIAKKLHISRLNGRDLAQAVRQKAPRRA